MILLTGAVIGAVFGVAMRARQNAADATFAALQVQEEEQHVAVAAAPPPAPVAPVVISPSNFGNAGTAAPPQQAPVALPQQPYANVPFGLLVVSPVPTQQPVAQVAQTAPTPPAATPQPKSQPQRHAWWGKPAAGAHPSLSAKVNQPAKEKDDGYKVASAGNDEPREQPKASKPAKEPKEAKEAREPAEPKETKRAEAKPGKKGSDEADKVLKAAMGATENTL